MEEVGMTDAKTRFAELAEQVSITGQPIVITNGGEPLVEITPTRDIDARQMTREEAFAQVAQLWKTVEPITKEEIKQSIEEGRNRCPDV